MGSGFGRAATDEELSVELGLKAEQLAGLRAAAVRPTSLDAPVGDEGTSQLSEIVEDETAQTPFQELDDKTLQGLIGQLLSDLNPREAGILRERYGLVGAPEKTLDEIGQKFGVTRERIRQLQNLALVKLRRMIDELDHSRAAA